MRILSASGLILSDYLTLRLSSDLVKNTKSESVFYTKKVKYLYREFEQ
jgi:hypothetical protein